MSKHKLGREKIDKESKVVQPTANYGTTSTSKTEGKFIIIHEDYKEKNSHSTPKP